MNTYVAAPNPQYYYPALGDPKPPSGAKVLLLSIGGICVPGQWSDSWCVAWCPLPKRNKDKEAQLDLLRKANRAA